MFKRFFSSLSTWQQLLLGLCVALAIFLLTRGSKRRAKVKIPSDVPYEIFNHLLYRLNDYGYDGENMRPYIIALSAMESARWSSDLYDYANNPWGMRDPEQRETSSIGSTPAIGSMPAGFAIYFSDAYACKDFVYYLNAKRSPKRFDTFYDFIEFIQSKGYEPNLSTNEYFQRCLNAVS